MRLATFNVMSGRSLVDGLVALDRLRDAIAGLDADVLALQEVDRGQPRSDGHDLTAAAIEAVARRPGHDPPLPGVMGRFAATVVGTPGGSWRPATDRDDADAAAHHGVAHHGMAGCGGAHDGVAGCGVARCGVAHYGVALISRWPVRSWHTYRLRPAPLRAPIFVPGPVTPAGAPSGDPTSLRAGGPIGAGSGAIILLRDEPRLVLAAIIDTPTGPMTVACTHLSFVPGWNVGQLARTLRWLRGMPGPRFLLGDLNLPAAIASPLATAAGWQLLARRPTYPSARPRVQFDHILVHPRRSVRARTPGLIRAETPSTPVGDHRPLVVELAG